MVRSPRFALNLTFSATTIAASALCLYLFASGGKSNPADVVSEEAVTPLWATEKPSVTHLPKAGSPPAAPCVEAPYRAQSSGHAETSHHVAAAATAPDRQTLRREAEANPHSTSTAFAVFALSTAQRMSEAVQNLALAGPLMTELVDLVEAPDTAEVVAATALKHARSLSLCHPALAPQAESAERRASRRIVELSK